MSYFKDYEHLLEPFSLKKQLELQLSCVEDELKTAEGRYKEYVDGVDFYARKVAIKKQDLKNIKKLIKEL